ncbi:MAG TPA: STAS domain-containing protein [Steroidobacteraceae bacterium]|nr:STAS domain-containing protein [Steroidobacteraceae bacterium]
MTSQAPWAVSPEEIDLEAPIRIEGEMTIYSASACNTRLMAALLRRSGRPAAIDLSRVTEIDTAGLQILLMARRVAAVRGGSVALIDPSPPARELLELCGLQGLIAESGRAESHPTPAVAA